MTRSKKTYFPTLTLSAIFFMASLLPPLAHAASMLTDTHWRLIEINGQPAAPGAGDKELDITLSSDGSKVHGFSGCNRFMGGYTQENKQIQFGPLAGTMMACEGTMDQEHTFLKTLERSRHFSINGEILSLYGNDELLILKFTSATL